MPKMKTHSGAKKRLHVTGSGKVGYKKSGRGHLLRKKNETRARRLRLKGYLGKTLEKNVKVLLPYA